MTIDFNKNFNNYYFIIYDLEDNIIDYIDNIKELVSFTGIKKNRLTYNFKRGIDKGFIYYQYNNTYRKIYIFYDDES